jgi:hypothetical protein
LAGYGRGICHFNSVKNPIKAATGGTFHMPLVAGNGDRCRGRYSGRVTRFVDG